MSKAERLAVFNEVDLEQAGGTDRSKAIAHLYMPGLSYRQIAERYQLSSSRIGQILNKQVRLCLYRKHIQSDEEFQNLVAFYREEIRQGILFRIESTADNFHKHLLAHSEAERLERDANM